MGSRDAEHPSGQEVGGGVALEGEFDRVRSGERLESRKVATPPPGAREAPSPRTKHVAQRAGGAQYSSAPAQGGAALNASGGVRKPSRKVKRAGNNAQSSAPAVAAETVSSAMRRLEGKAQRGNL